MSADIDGPAVTRVHAIEHGQVVIEQSTSVIELNSSERIVAVVEQLHEQLHACYDYCAAWKDPPTDSET